MHTYFFLLGTTPELSLLELQAVLGHTKAELVVPRLVQVDSESELDLFALQERLGGTVKIYRSLEVIDNDEAVVFNAVRGLLLREKASNFTVAYYENPGPQPLRLNLSELKRSLSPDLKARFIETQQFGASASVLLHQKVWETGLVFLGDMVHLAECVTVQNIDDWSRRDRDKPYADRKKGMLPPKIARIMVNLGLGALGVEPKDDTPITVYDPFCGTGTILSEAALVGATVVGSDLDPAQAEGAKANLAWLAVENNQDISSTLFVSDVSQVSKHQTGQIDLIVTEPFLGKPKPQPQKLPNIFTGLERLYLGAFKTWKTLLPVGGVVVIIFPKAEMPKQTFTLTSLIDKLNDLGYTTISGPVTYARPQAVIQREIYVFKKIK